MSASDKAKSWLFEQQCNPADVASLTALLDEYADERLEEAARECGLVAMSNASRVIRALKKGRP